MKQLLEKWAEIEPERCRINSFTSTEETYYLILFDNYWHEVLECQLPETGNAELLPLTAGIIQMALQEAIVAQHWEFEQRWWGVNFEALIYPQKPFGLIIHQGDSFAEALLKAYLEGLEMLRGDALALNSGELS